MKWYKSIGKVIPLRYHIYFWIVYFTINVIRWGSFFDDYVYSLKSNIVEFSIHIILSYFVLYYLMPKYILKRKYGLFVLYLSLLLIAVYFIRTGLTYYLVSKDIWPEAFGHQKAFTLSHFTTVFFGEIYVVAFVGGIKLMADWLYEREQINQLKQAKLDTEIKLLKSQIRPHFFFNILNNLYALTLEKSDLAPGLVLKLSEIMEFVIYDSQKNYVYLSDEIRYIKNYIGLEKIRFGNRIRSKIDIQESLLNVKLPPLLFLPFVENSFKHGLKNNPDFFIEIIFKHKDQNKLYFSITNNHKKNFQNKDTKPHGLGLKNVKKRLNILYPDNHELIIFSSDQIYKVELTIPIKHYE